MTPQGTNFGRAGVPAPRAGVLLQTKAALAACLLGCVSAPTLEQALSRVGSDSADLVVLIRDKERQPLEWGVTVEVLASKRHFPANTLRFSYIGSQPGPVSLHGTVPGEGIFHFMNLDDIPAGFSASVEQNSLMLVGRFNNIMARTSLLVTGRAYFEPNGTPASCPRAAVCIQETFVCTVRHRDEGWVIMYCMLEGEQANGGRDSFAHHRRYESEQSTDAKRAFANRFVRSSVLTP